MFKGSLRNSSKDFFAFLRMLRFCYGSLRDILRDSSVFKGSLKDFFFFRDYLGILRFFKDH